METKIGNGFVVASIDRMWLEEELMMRAMRSKGIKIERSKKVIKFDMPANFVPWKEWEDYIKAEYPLTPDQCYEQPDNRLE